MLGKTIARLRRQKGLTQEKLAETIHVTQGSVSQWETGRTKPDVQQMFILAEFFGISVEELSSGEFKQASVSVNPLQKKTSADKKSEAKDLLDRMNDEQCQATLQYMKFLMSQN